MVKIDHRNNNNKKFNNHKNNHNGNKNNNVNNNNFNNQKNNYYKGQNNNIKNKNPSANAQILINLKNHTIQQLYDMAQKYYLQLKSESRNDKWNEYISQKGTKKDKITFIASQILKKPQSSLDKFQLLTKWTLDPNHNFALPSCQALSNIYIEHVFGQKPLLKVFLDSVQQYIKSNKKDSTVKKGDLIGFYLQHHIKHFYSEMLRGITQLLTSTVSHIKKTSIQLLASLSRFKQMRRLIFTTLINKFGDSDLEIVNQVSKSLKSQFYQDILASQVLLQEAEAFLFRDNLSEKPQFYVVNFLNNINLKFFSEKSLTKLFELFFHFFNKLMDKETQQKSISSRLFLNSIKGLNKIFAFMKSGNKQNRAVIEEKVQKVYKTFHKTQNTKAKVQLLLFLFQSCTVFKGSISDRFYRILYEFLSTNQIAHCSIAQMFFDLLLICMKQDQNMNRILAFIKKLLQLCFEADSNFITTCLILINKVILQKDSIQIMMRQKQNSLQDDEQIKIKSQNDEKILPYDMNKRQPLYAGAQKTNIWQLRVFKNHYHPTVRKFTQHILKNQQIPYSGSNPLLELSLTSFVQKLSLKKQKKSDSWKLKMKKNLSKMRTSKYESLLQKPLNSFKQNQEFIKKYLQKREIIHQNKKGYQTKDIQQFADNVIEKQMDRLNAREQSDDQLSLSRDEFEDQDQVYQGQGQELQDIEQQNQENELEDLDQDLGDSQEEFGDQEQFEEEYKDQDILDQQMQPQDEQQDLEQNQSQGEPESKQFQDVFDDIGDSPQFPKKKNKAIHKNKQKFKNKNNNSIKNSKNSSYKNMKKQYKKGNNNGGKNKNNKNKKR